MVIGITPLIQQWERVSLVADNKAVTKSYRDEWTGLSRLPGTRMGWCQCPMDGFKQTALYKRHERGTYHT